MGLCLLKCATTITTTITVTATMTAATTPTTAWIGRIGGVRLIVGAPCRLTGFL